MPIIITPNSISGIVSLTSSSSSAISFYNSSGTQTLGDVNVSSINSGPISGTRNRIINGDMRIDQRNAGVSTVLTPALGFYTLDRWAGQESTDGAATIIRSATAPVGFTSSLLWTTTTADTSLAAGQYTSVYQPIEGYNISDLAWGTSSAKSVTLSFWTRSSLTGTFSGGIQNGSLNRSYPFTYTISSSNTFEYKTITIPGDTTGTWSTDNTVGMYVGFSLGNGSITQGTANTWQAGNFVAVSGETPVIGTLNATWYITGVQLEAGTVATPFERRSYGQELALCQRYFEKSYDLSVLPGSVADAGAWESVSINIVNFYDFGRLKFQTRKRTTPSISLYSTDGTFGVWRNISINANQGNSATGNVSETGAHLYCSNSAMSANNAFRTHWTASAEL